MKIQEPLTAVLDACILYSAPLRDLMLWLALEDVYNARWTNKIHDEWISNLLANRKDLRPEQLEKTRTNMNAHIRDCLVSGYEHLIDDLTLPDQNDSHVLAAAIKSKSSTIVTFNQKDFPIEYLRQYQIKTQHPDYFIAEILDTNPISVCKAITSVHATLRNPAISIAQLLRTYEKLNLCVTVQKLTAMKHLL